MTLGERGRKKDGGGRKGKEREGGRARGRRGEDGEVESERESDGGRGREGRGQTQGQQWWEREMDAGERERAES